VPMYWAGWRHNEMLTQFTEDGRLQYQFLDMVNGMQGFYALRALGGLLFLVGVVFMIVNIWATVKRGNFLANEEAEAPALAKNYAIHGQEHWHRWIERKPVQMLVLSLVAVAIGGVIEMIPTFMVESNIPTIASVKPYTPLELEGRDIYLREGCYNCHSQMVRPFRAETERYGEYSKAGEFVYDHPFQWGSKRTGPDLAREGYGNNKKSNSWHYNHMADPTSTSPTSIMPRYPWLLTDEIDEASIPAKIRAMQTLGVPYEQGYDLKAIADLQKQAMEIYTDLKAQEDQLLLGEKGLQPNQEIIAMIAYLQRLGHDITVQEQAVNSK
jgi:cytochrome c oxidase cbb3-type subunit I/II